MEEMVKVCDKCGFRTSRHWSTLNYCSNCGEKLREIPFGSEEYAIWRKKYTKMGKESIRKKIDKLKEFGYKILDNLGVEQ